MVEEESEEGEDCRMILVQEDDGRPTRDGAEHVISPGFLAKLCHWYSEALEGRLQHEADIGV